MVELAVSTLQQAFFFQQTWVMVENKCPENRRERGRESEREKRDV